MLFVCGTAESASAILVKQSSAMASRPRQIMVGDLISDNKRILILPFGDKWKRYRKILHEALTPAMARNYEPIQQEEATRTAVAIGRDPATFQHQFRRYAASVIMTVAYDYRVKDINDPLVTAVEENGFQLLPGASPLDTYALLNWLPLPLNPWKRIGKELHAKELDLFLGVHRDTRQRALRGEAGSCFSTLLQEKQAQHGLTDEEACYLSGSLFGAGSDTSSSALAIFVMAMITHPDVVKKAQTELDKVIGSQRLPTFQDQDDLPYLRALCQEVHRWRPVSSGGFQHQLTEDVTYKDYVLPKGSAIVGNHWSIHLDPAEYPEPDVFKPERFLDEEGQVRGTAHSPKGHFQFGFGRRACVGLNVAERSVYINAAIMLWAFDFRAPDGRVDLVDTLAFTNSANSHPLPFKA